MLTVRFHLTTIFAVNRTSNGDPYVLDYAHCISLLGQASTGNGTESNHGGDGVYNAGTSFERLGNLDSGTVFAEAIYPSGVICMPWDVRPWDCRVAT